MIKVWLALTIILLSVYVQAQDPFVGHFVDQQQTATIRLQRVGDNYQGHMTGGQLTYQLWGQRNGNILSGQISSGGMSFPLYAEDQGNFLMFMIAGVPVQFFRRENVTGGQPPQQQGYPDQSHSQDQNPTSQNQVPPYRTPQHNVPPYNQTQSSYPQTGSSQTNNAAQQIAGARMHWITKTSILSSSSGGAYGEIDFCSNGQFLDYSESSVSVQGGTYNYNTGQYSSSAGAASTSNSQGRWQVTNENGELLLVMNYHNGNTYSYYVSNVLDGSWRDGQYKYAMDWGKAQCQ